MRLKLPASCFCWTFISFTLIQSSKLTQIPPVTKPYLIYPISPQRFYKKTLPLEAEIFISIIKNHHIHHLTLSHGVKSKIPWKT